LLLKADKNTISINKKNGNKMKTEGQQYREMERKDSNIFVHKGAKRKKLRRNTKNHRKKNDLLQTNWSSSYGIKGFKEKNDISQITWTSSYGLGGSKNYDKSSDLPSLTGSPIPSAEPSMLSSSVPTVLYSDSPSVEVSDSPSMVHSSTTPTASPALSPTKAPIPKPIITSTPTLMKKKKCPFEAYRYGIEDMVTQANNGKIQLNVCSCEEHVGATYSYFSMGHTINETYHDDDGNKWQVYGTIGFGVHFYGGEYTYQIHDMMFSTEEGTYNACLQVLLNNCEMLSNVPDPDCY